jgi:SAM-dependent methyltransferase
MGNIWHPLALLRECVARQVRAERSALLACSWVMDKREVRTLSGYGAASSGRSRRADKGQNMSVTMDPASLQAAAGKRDDLALREDLVRTAKDWGYFTGAIKSRRDLWKGRRILDVGMGGGPHSVAFMAGGCSTYVGVDPMVGTDHVRDFRNIKDPSIPAYHAFPFSMRDIMDIMPDVHLYPGFLEDNVDKIRAHKIDIAILDAVTEHLADPHAVFRGIWELLIPGGLVWFSHCNYYSWTGHHANPRSVAGWDRSNPAQNAVVDWQHLDPANVHYQNANFNRVRHQDLRDLIDKYFEIVEWRVSVAALERLTPEIRAKYKKYTLEELLGQVVYVTGRRRDVPLPTDLSGRKFHHPPEDYRADADYTRESTTRYDLMNSVYIGSDGVISSHSDNDFGGQRIMARMDAGDRFTLQKFIHELEFTVKEAIVMPSGERRVRITEPVPEIAAHGNHDQWAIIRHVWAS